MRRGARSATYTRAIATAQAGLDILALLPALPLVVLLRAAGA